MRRGSQGSSESIRRSGQLLFNEQALGGKPLPWSGLVQLRDQLGGFELRQVRRPKVAGRRWRDPPDPAAVVSLDESVLLLQVARDRRVVLDDLPVEIHHVERSVRACAHPVGPEPLIGRGEEFSRAFSLRPRGLVPGSIAAELGAPDHVLLRVTGEVAAQVFFSEELRPIDQLAAGGGEVAVSGCLHGAVKLDPARILAAGHTPGVRLADGEDPRVLSRVGYGPGRWYVGVTSQVSVGQRDGVEGMGAGADEEPVSGVGKAEAKGVVGSGYRFDRAAIGLEAKIVSSQVDLAAEVRARYRRAPVGSRYVDPVVLSPPRIVDGSLDDMHLEAIKEGLADIRFSITCAVVQIDDLVCRDGDDAPARGDNTKAARQVICPGVGSVHLSISI